MYVTPISKERVNDRGLLSYTMIIKAISGDPLAIDHITNHYDQLMDYLSTCHIRSEEGYLVPMINMEIKDRLTSKLVQAIMRFSIERFDIHPQSNPTYQKCGQE